MVVQERDRAALRAVARHRYLTSDHIQALAYPGTARRICQFRLRRLWEHGFLDRLHLPVVLAGNQRGRQNNRPLYMLARRGAEVASADTDASLFELPHTPAQNAAGYGYLAHNLVATDFLVALEVACRGRTDVELVAVERETTLRKRLAVSQDRSPAVVSDGAFTLRYPDDGRRVTFHLEVVRAGVKGGNNNLRQKFERYVALNRAGYFARVFGHDQVRAVLVVTTSPTRVEHLRALAASLPHGRRLFWFTCYEEVRSIGVPVTSFTASNVLSPIWRTAIDELPLSLLPTVPVPRLGSAA